jgi:hypothetical protein
MAETDDFREPRPAGPDRRDNVASAGLDPDTWDELEEWGTDRRLSRSEATRKLIRAGLDAETGTGWRDRAGSAFALVVVTGYPTIAAAGGATEIAVGWIAVVALAVLFEPWIGAATDRIPNPLNWFRS